MRFTKSLLIAGVIGLFCSSLGNAQIIYSNVFNGSAVSLNGTAPSVANSIGGGLNSARWTCTYTN
ncbi:MAG TPA: hypothetical protein VGY98_05475, partial [Verrucomicrobiae bacterium]|nr:hypothetical protein [Verrucomicrobiae bacterium]